ncbi:MAG: hypothetical protein ACJ8AO_22190 [Gemmatimonadaceae bacterium]
MTGTSAAPDAASGWRPRDCHAHTSLSDGELAPSEMVRVVRSRGALPSVADHISRDVRYSVASLDELRAYFDTLDRETGPDVARGGEFCWHDSLWRELPDDLARRFTHRVGSLHAVLLPGGGQLHMFQKTFPSSLTLDAYMDIHVACVERLAAEMPVDVFAHPTLLPIPIRGLPLEALWTEAREERAVEALRRAGIAFEISNRYRPHERFVRRAAERGVRISLGSDGHTRAQVGELTAPLAMARAAGVRDEDLYDPFRHGSRTLG